MFVVIWNAAGQALAKTWNAAAQSLAWGRLDRRSAGDPLDQRSADRRSHSFSQSIALVVLVLAITLQGCISTGGLQAYSNAARGYRFNYPVGWVQVQVKGGPDVVFRDIIHDSENVSVVINSTNDGTSLTALGSPTDVGYRLSKSAIAPPDSGRTADLLNAVARQVGETTYYLLEYAVHLPGQERHDLASVAVRRGKLYTLNISTLEDRWDKVKAMFDQVVQSFQVD